MDPHTELLNSSSSSSSSSGSAYNSTITTPRSRRCASSRDSLCCRRSRSAASSSRTSSKKRVISSPLCKFFFWIYRRRSLGKTNGYHSSYFTFDSVYSECQKQDKFYQQQVRSLVTDFVLNAKSSCVLLFGPSSSGKTFTLLGKPGQYGILPRALDQILSQRKQEHTELQSFGDEAPLLNV